MRMVIVNWRVMAIVVAALLVVTPALLGRRSVVVESASRSATLTVPAYLHRLFGGYAVMLSPEGGQLAILRIGLFESPVALLAGPQPSQVICIYDFDVSMETVVFDLAQPRAGVPPELPSDLAHIVLASKVAVRKGDPAEIRYAAGVIHAFTPGEYRQNSIPTIDLGFVQMHAPPQNVVTRLTDMIGSFRVTPP